MVNKTVLLVGGGSEIGSAIANEARNTGYQVIITTRNGVADSIAMDVRDDASVQAGIQQAIHIAGRVDALIYAPAITDSKLIHSAEISSWQSVFDVNVLGALRVTKTLLPHFMKQRDGVWSIHFIYGRNSGYRRIRCLCRFKSGAQ
jgi:3-oxoacyl-[acyl-carrier protein] reductase